MTQNSNNEKQLIKADQITTKFNNIILTKNHYQSKYLQININDLSTNYAKMS